MKFILSFITRLLLGSREAEEKLPTLRVASTENPEAQMLGSTSLVGHKNMLLLIQLRWIAVTGQMITIVIVPYLTGIHLPIRALLLAPAALIFINMTSYLLLRYRTDVLNMELFFALLVDVAALTWQLYLTGGVTNPFISLFLLQVVLGAVLLETRSTWIIVGIACLCFSFLNFSYRPLELPLQHEGNLFSLYLQGSLVCFALITILLVMFITRINRNLRNLDARLAALRQYAAEEDHIVRMGLLASGAAHELGTPLSSLSVILSDWRRMPLLARHPDMLQEIEEMDMEVQRCKSIVTGILLSAGEARGEAPGVTTVKTFLDELIGEWRMTHAATVLNYQNNFGADLSIVSDPALKKVVFNVLDNAFDVSPNAITIAVERSEDMLKLQVTDCGQGFTPDMLMHFGKPYQSSKGKLGGGIGLFLVTNVVRKLGGFVTAHNRSEGGAVVTLNLPLAALALGNRSHER